MILTISQAIVDTWASSFDAALSRIYKVLWYVCMPKENVITYKVKAKIEIRGRRRDCCAHAIYTSRYTIRLDVFHASWKISTQEENLHDALLRKPISKSFIDTSRLTCLVVSENEEEHYAIILFKQVTQKTSCK